MTVPLRARDVQQLGDVVTQLRRTLRRQMRLASAHAALPMAQIEVLQCVAEREPARVGEIAEALNLAINTVSTLSAALVETGKLSRARAEQDKRGVVLTLTASGRDYLEGYQRDLEELLAAAMQTLDEVGRSSLLSAMPALQQVVDGLSTPASRQPSAVPG